MPAAAAKSSNPDGSNTVCATDAESAGSGAPKNTEALANLEAGSTCGRATHDLVVAKAAVDGAPGHSGAVATGAPGLVSIFVVSRIFNVKRLFICAILLLTLHCHIIYVFLSYHNSSY